MLDLQTRNLPPSHPQSLKTNQYFHLQGYKIKNMIIQVNTILSHLLKDLETIYRTNGLNFNICQFYDTVVRLLTPFQLLSHFQVVDNSDMFLALRSRSKQKDKFQYPNGIGMPNSQINSRINKQYQDYNTGFLKFENTKQNLKLIPTAYDTQLEQKAECQQNRQQKPRKYVKSAQKAKKKYFYRRQRTKPILNSEIECELVQWVFRKIAENKRIRRKDIAKKALKLSGNQEGFEGSVGWVNRFLGRHPNLRQVLTKRAKDNLGRKEYNQQDQQNILQQQSQNSMRQQQNKQSKYQQNFDESVQISQNYSNCNRSQLQNNINDKNQKQQYLNQSLSVQSKNNIISNKNINTNNNYQRNISNLSINKNKNGFINSLTNMNQNQKFNESINQNLNNKNGYNFNQINNSNNYIKLQNTQESKQIYKNSYN